jgi:RNA polymerase sigma factor (sigma-70 family)
MSPRDSQVEELIDRYGQLVASIVRRIAGHNAALMGDDVEQRVRVALWRRLEREEKIEYPASYIYRMAVRETVRALRQENAHAAVPLDDAGVAVLDCRDPHHALEAREERAAIHASLAAMRPDRRRAVWQHLAGHAVSEIMEMQGWSYQRARNLIARGLADLRQSLRARHS